MDTRLLSTLGRPLGHLREKEKITNLWLDGYYYLLVQFQPKPEASSHESPEARAELVLIVSVVLVQLQEDSNRRKIELSASTAQCPKFDRQSIKAGATSPRDIWGEGGRRES